MVDPGFATAQVVKLTGSTVALLDNWHRSRFLSPSIDKAPGTGSSRRYSFRDVVAIRAVMSLRASGISMQSMRKIVSYLRAHKKLSASEALASTTLISDGRDVYEVAGDVMLSTLRKPGQRGFFALPLDEIVADLQARTRELTAA